jgi:hypothetical protein
MMTRVRTEGGVHATKAGMVATLDDLARTGARFDLRQLLLHRMANHMHPPEFLHTHDDPVLVDHLALRMTASSLSTKRTFLLWQKRTCSLWDYRLSGSCGMASVTNWLPPPSRKPSQGLINVQDEVRGGELMMSLVPWESTVRGRASSRDHLVGFRKTRLRAEWWEPHCVHNV